MNLYGYLCAGGVEVANADRIAAYVRNGFLGANYNAYCEECDGLRDAGEFYDRPSTDGAPWYDINFWDSDEFLGILPQRIELSTGLSRQVASRAGDGGVLSPLRMRSRVLTFSGLMLAENQRGMAYGERWLNEVLAGDRCADGCEGDDIVILPACPESGYDPIEQAFRSLVGCGITDGPTFTPLGNFPEGKVSQVSFQLASSEPYLFGLAERLITATVPSDAAASLTTPEWVDGGVFVIDIINDGTVDATDITIDGRISLDGSCPVSGTASSVAPSWSYVIPTLGPGDRLTIDGRRRRAVYYDASCKEASSGLPYITFEGPWKNPDFGPCTTLCVEVGIGTGAVELTVDGHLRWK